MSEEKKLSAEQIYYRKNRERVSEYKKQRYASNSAYRNKILQAGRKRKKRKKLSSLALPVEKIDHKSKPVTVIINGKELTIDMCSISVLASILYRTSVTIRSWERQGYFPEAMYRTQRGVRLYTVFQLKKISEIYIRLRRSLGSTMALDLRKRTLFFDNVKRVWEKYPHGIEEEIEI